MHAVLYPDHDAFIRRVKRFYSKTFHVPLPQVDNLDEESVLLTYWEEMLEQMLDEDRDELCDKLTETDEEREARENKEKVAESKDDEFLATLNKEVMSGVIRGPPKERRRKLVIKKPAPKQGEAPEPPPSPPPDIHMNFGDVDGNLPAEWALMDSLGPPPKK
jgi:hypothetical protein